MVGINNYINAKENYNAFIATNDRITANKSHINNAMLKNFIIDCNY